MPAPASARLHYTYPLILQSARDMRHPLTPAESLAWNRLRNNQIGYKIRRQYPLFRFIADFYCASAKLLIEIDGDSHAAPDQALYDTARTEWLEARGYKVIRFTNADCHQTLDTVIQNIHIACELRTHELQKLKPARLYPTPHSKAPFPAGEGRGEGDLLPIHTSHAQPTH